MRQLKPQPVDPRVGIRDMDVQDPGSNIPGITNPAVGGVLRLGGALQVPDADLDPAQLAQRQAYENWDQPYPDDVPEGARGLHQPARRLRRAERGRRERGQRPGARRQRRPRPADHLAAVLADGTRLPSGC